MNRTNRKAFEAMIRESKRTGMPQRFPTDLTTHDRAFLERQTSDVQFMWALRPDGTTIVALGFRDGVGNGPVQMVRSIARENDGSRFYVWDGVALIGLSAADAITSIHEMERALRDEALIARQTAD